MGRGQKEGLADLKSTDISIPNPPGLKGRTGKDKMERKGGRGKVEEG